MAVNQYSPNILDIYILDYMKKKGFNQWARLFAYYAHVYENQIEVDTRGGFLKYWWSKFWPNYTKCTEFEKSFEIHNKYLDIDQMLDSFIHDYLWKRMLMFKDGGQTAESFKMLNVPVYRAAQMLVHNDDLNNLWSKYWGAGTKTQIRYNGRPYKEDRLIYSVWQQQLRYLNISL